MTPDLVSKLPLPEAFEAEYLRFNGILPLELVEGRLRVAVAGEPAPEVLDDLEVLYGAPVEPVPVGREQLDGGIRRAFAAAESMLELVRDLEGAAAPDPGSLDCPGFTGC